MKVATVSDIIRLDEKAANKYGISRLLLMENAAMAIRDVIEIEFGIKGTNILVLAGPGNNGGDGLAAARLIHSYGGDIEVSIFNPTEKFRGEAKINFDIARNIGIPIHRVKNIEELRGKLENADLIIDALFGTGLNRELTGIYKEAIDEINRSYVPVVSVDIPSGVNGDNGKIMGTAVYADYTVTFGLPKPGHFLYPGADYVGKLYLSHISYPRELIDDENLYIEINKPVLIPPRYRDTHKGDYGRCIFIAGSRKYMGAPFLASYSFLLSGGGMSYLATVESISGYIAQKGCEIIMYPLNETSEGYISRENIEKLLREIDNMDFVVIGPGLGLSKDTEDIVTGILKNIEKPVLVDGDGLTILSKHMSLLDRMENQIVLTPHPGEMSRLTGIEINKIKQNRLDVVRKFSEKHSVYTVLKGANTLIGYPDGRIFINTSGNPGMATAGSGDVLAGIIPALYCQGMDIGDAVRTGVFIHGLAGDIAALRYEEEGVTASRIMRNIHKALRFILEKYDEIIDTCYYSVYLI